MAEPWTPALSIREAAGVDLRWFEFLYELGSIAARGDDIRERVFLPGGLSAASSGWDDPAGGHACERGARGRDAFSGLLMGDV